MNYSVCIDALFPGKPPEESVRLVKSLGFSAVEFWSWWDKDLRTLREACVAEGVSIATFCTKFQTNPGDSSQRATWLAGLQESIAAAKTLDCNCLIAQAGWELPGISFEQHRASLTATLRAAVPLLEMSDTTLILEPLNTRVDHPGYHLVHAEDAFDLLKEIDSPNVKLLYDIYHQQISDGDLTNTIKKHIGAIGHFHAAAVPGRVEPTIGEINYTFLLNQIACRGYTGYIGLEYMPKQQAEKTLTDVHEMIKSLTV